MVLWGGVRGPGSLCWGAEEQVCAELERVCRVESVYGPLSCKQICTESPAHPPKSSTRRKVWFPCCRLHFRGLKGEKFKTQTHDFPFMGRFFCWLTAFCLNLVCGGFLSCFSFNWAFAFGFSPASTEAAWVFNETTSLLGLDRLLPVSSSLFCSDARLYKIIHIKIYTIFIH